MIQMTMQLSTMQLPSKRCNSYKNLGWRKRGLPHLAALLGPAPLASFLACQHCKIYPAFVQDVGVDNPMNFWSPSKDFCWPCFAPFLGTFHTGTTN